MVEPLPAEFSYQIEMLSDWHLGSGAGLPGGIDRQILRDEDGFPFIPAKSLAGMWRDACERLAFGLDNGNEGVWNEWVRFLFGDQVADQKKLGGKLPAPAVFFISNARLPAALRDRLRGLDMSLTFIKPGVRIDPESGQAKTDFLRFEEVARRGAILEGTVGLRLEGTCDQMMTGVAILHVGAHLLERLGGKRRRGMGRCSMRLCPIAFQESKHAPEDDLSSEWVHWLETDNPPQVPWVGTEPVFPGVALQKGGVPAADDNWQSVSLKITLEEPVLSPMRTVGNVIKTLDFIPGTYFLPRLTQVLGRQEVDAGPALARGDLLVLAAHPELAGERRGQPVPFAFAQEKNPEPGHEPCWFNLLAQNRPSGRQLKPIRSGYMGEHDETWHWYDLTKGMQTHNQVEDEHQRPTEEVGGIYSYEYLQAGTVWCSEIRWRGEPFAGLKDPWWEALSGKMKLGYAKKSGYGSVRVEVEGNPRAVEPSPSLSGGILTVWALSPILVRDPRLRPSCSVADWKDELERCLGVRLAPATALEGESSEFCRPFRLDSWHVGWGLPRPSLAGIAAGSCARFRLEGQLDPRKARELVAAGMGERRAEGYGQVAVNPRLLAGEQTIMVMPSAGNVWPSNDIRPLSPNDVDQGTFQFARVVERETWRRDIQRAALARAASGGILGPLDGISPSQLGSLREAVSRVNGPFEQNPGSSFVSWLEGVNGNPKRKEKWQRNLKRLGALCNDGGFIWRELEINPPVLTEGAASALQLELWGEALRTAVVASIQHQGKTARAGRGG